MPLSLNTYLTFDGNCREAFEFYRSVFGGEFDSIGTFGEAPPDVPTVPDDEKGRIMHVSLPISRRSSPMATAWGHGSRKRRTDRRAERTRRSETSLLDGLHGHSHGRHPGRGRRDAADQANISLLGVGVHSEKFAVLTIMTSPSPTP